MSEHTSPDFPEAFLERAEQAPFSPALTTAVITHGPGSTIVYDALVCTFRAVPATAPMPAEPEQVTVAGYADLAGLLGAKGPDMTLLEATEQAHAEAWDHLRAWADLGRMSALGPMARLRSALGAFGFRAARRSDMLADTVRDHFLRTDAPHMRVSVRYPGAARLDPAHPDAQLRVGVRDLGATADTLRIPGGDERPGTAAQEIARAVARYLGE